MKSTKTLSILLIPILILTGITPTVGVANASSPTDVYWTSTWETTDIIPLGSPGGQLRGIILQEGVWTGDFAGSITDELPYISHRADSNVLFNWWGPLTCECEYKGKTGTVVMQIPGTWMANQGNLTWNWVIVSSTDGLSNLHGQGTGTGMVTGIVGVDPDTGTPMFSFAGTLRGQVHFEP